MKAERTSGDLGMIPIACSPFGQEGAAPGMEKATAVNSAHGPEMKGFQHFHREEQERQKTGLERAEEEQCDNGVVQIYVTFQG